jgi:uncharacterized membrane-anchored protein YitT (DUF2179 family)
MKFLKLPYIISWRLKMKNLLKYNNKVSFFVIAMEYILLTLGCFITAYAFNAFLSPNQIASGGVTGTSLIVEHFTHIQPAYTQWALNIPLFILGVVLFGSEYGVKTAVGSVMLPLFIFITRDVNTITKDPILAAIFGGIFVGIGLGITFKSKGSTGGFSILVTLLHKKFGISIGKGMMIFDALVIIAAGIAFSPEKALYALITLYLTSKAIDIVQMGLNFSKLAFVISENNETISKAILEDLDRGLTKLVGNGGYTGKNKNVLMVVMGQNEVNKFKELVKNHDSNAFIIMCDTHEVLGKGFKLQQH